MKIRYIFLIISIFFFASPAFAEQATITWNANTESDLAGYKVYFGFSTGVYGDPIDIGLTETPLSPKYVITNIELPCGENKKIFVALTAYDTAGNESGFSSEGTKLFDVQPCPPTGLPEILAAIEEIRDLIKNAKIEIGIVPRAR